MSRFLLAAALLLAACDSGTPDPAPGGAGFLTATVSGAAVFDATTGTAALQNGFDIYGTDAAGRYLLVTTTMPGTGTIALGAQNTGFRYCTAYGTPASECMDVASGSLTVATYASQASAAGTFTFSGTLAGQPVTVSGGTFDVVQGANTP